MSEAINRDDLARVAFSSHALGGAVVVLDYDRDGRPYLFFVNGAPWPWEDAAAASATPCALYHNDGGGHFTDVTQAAGLAIVMQGMAAAAGDYDSDGYPDLYITGVGQNRLFYSSVQMGPKPDGYY